MRKTKVENLEGHEMSKINSMPSHSWRSKKFARVWDSKKEELEILLLSFYQ